MIDPTRRDAHPMHAGPYMLLGVFERGGFDDFHFVGRRFGVPERGAATFAVATIDDRHELYVPLDKATGCFVRTYLYDATGDLVGSIDSAPFSCLAAIWRFRDGGVSAFAA